MEVINMTGYVMNEKLEIAKQYLMPKAQEDTGLEAHQVQIPDETMRSLIRGYAREAGVRNLQQQLEKIYRKVSLKVVRNEADSVVINEDNLKDYLGNPRFTTDRLYDVTPPGVVMGLAYTQMGGATLYIETIWSKRDKSLHTTGRMGETMKETHHRSNPPCHPHPSPT